MAKSPHFFVPEATPDNQAEVYAELATRSGCTVPSLDKRIYSISFYHNGDQWTATVGQPLQGRRIHTSRSGGIERVREQSLSDPAVVLAIFAGTPYKVVTNDDIYGRRVGSAWLNPFMVGTPFDVIYFS